MPIAYRTDPRAGTLRRSRPLREVAQTCACAVGCTSQGGGCAAKGAAVSGVHALSAARPLAWRFGDWTSSGWRVLLLGGFRFEMPDGFLEISVLWALGFFSYKEGRPPDTERTGRKLWFALEASVTRHVGKAMRFGRKHVGWGWGAHWSAVPAVQFRVIVPSDDCRWAFVARSDGGYWTKRSEDVEESTWWLDLRGIR